MDKKKAVICGGHFSPSLSLIEELKTRNKFEIHYIGRRHALEGDKSLSIETKCLRDRDINYYTIITGRLERYLSITRILSLCKIPLGLAQSIYLLLKIKPDIVVSFGGYVALPVCIAAWTVGIPVITHEQTPVLGLSNRIISRFARYLCLSWINTKYVPQNGRTIITGNPVRKSILKPGKLKIQTFGNENLPLIYITGGSLGSSSVNKVVSKILPQLVSKYRVLHQCGDADNGSDFKMLIRIKDSLPLITKRNYQVIKHLEPEKVGSVLHTASILVGRSGANTVAEAALSNIPAIFIPLPWSAENEQEYNAAILVKEGLALMIKQSDLTGEKLISTINYMTGNIEIFNRKASEVSKLYPKDAAVKIADLMESIISS